MFASHRFSTDMSTFHVSANNTGYYRVTVSPRPRDALISMGVYIPECNAKDLGLAFSPSFLLLKSPLLVSPNPTRLHVSELVSLSSGACMLCVCYAEASGWESLRLAYDRDPLPSYPRKLSSRNARRTVTAEHSISRPAAAGIPSQGVVRASKPPSSINRSICIRA